MTRGILSAWLSAQGDYVEEGSDLFELETDKATVTVPSPASGALSIDVAAGTEIAIGASVGFIDTDVRAGVSVPPPSPARPDAPAVAPEPAPEVPPPQARVPEVPSRQERAPQQKPPGGRAPAAPEPDLGQAQPALSPAARRVAEEAGLSAEEISGTGRGGRITKEDAVNAAARKRRGATGGNGGRVSGGQAPRSKELGWEAADRAAGPQAPGAQAAPGMPAGPQAPGPSAASQASGAPSTGRQAPGGQAAPRAPSAGRQAAPGAAGRRRVPLSTIRKRIAERLVEAQRNTAYLTTFNEVDMEKVMDLRSRYRDEFERDHGVKLGFMSFFVKACCLALRELPEVNAMIEGDEVVYNDSCHIGVAVSTERGLLVPVIRDADDKSLAELETITADIAVRARERKILPDELSGGTFTITNGGVFGSLLSTPLPNYPQTAILGMHAIQRRPMAAGDRAKGDERIVIKPMMYVALTYDHRLIDGRDAVTFLRRVKELVEDPDRLLLEV